MYLDSLLLMKFIGLFTKMVTENKPNSNRIYKKTLGKKTLRQFVNHLVVYEAPKLPANLINIIAIKVKIQ